jgi:hypothetical protein
MIFNDGGSYQCTGSLISSSSQPALPFFLTTSHCISTPEERVFNRGLQLSDARLGDAAGVIGQPASSHQASFVSGQPMAIGDFSLLQ